MLLNALHGQVPGLYANGFGIVGSASDLTVVLMVNNNPVAYLSLSHITAKSLGEDLAKAVIQFEQATKEQIKSIRELTELLKKQVGEGNVRKL
jgi:hypothetical protein